MGKFIKDEGFIKDKKYFDFCREIVQTTFREYIRKLRKKGLTGLELRIYAESFKSEIDWEVAMTLSKWNHKIPVKKYVEEK